VIIVDANGKKVGVLSEPVDKPAVEFLLPDRSIVAVTIQPNGFNQYATFFYSSADCSGTPYVDAANYFEVGPSGALTPDELVPSAPVAPPGNTLWEPDLSSVTSTFSPGSVSSFGQGCSACAGNSCVAVSGSYVPLQAVVDLNTLFTPPFHAGAAAPSTAAACCGDCNQNGTVTVDEILTSVDNALTGCPAAAASTAR